MPVEFYVHQKPHFLHERLALRQFLEELRSCPLEKLVCVVISPIVQGHEKDLILISESAVALVEVKSLMAIESYERKRVHLSADGGQWKYGVPGGSLKTVGGASEDGSPYNQVFQGRHHVEQAVLQGKIKWSQAGREWRKNDILDRLYGWVAIAPGFDGDPCDLGLQQNQFSGTNEPWFRVIPIEELAVAFYKAQQRYTRFTPDEARTLATSLAPLCTDLEALLPPISVQPSVWTTPPIVQQLVGREEERSKLLNALDDPSAAALVIQGIGGVGRSALAAYVAGQAKARDFRVRWLECAELAETLTLDGFLASAAGDIVDSWRERIRNPRVPPDERMDAALDYYGQRRTLFVFEDYHALKPQADFHRFVERAARHRPNVKVLLTSRELLTDDLKPADGLCGVELQPLDEETFAVVARSLVRSTVLTAADIHILHEKLHGNVRALEITSPLIRQFKLGNRLAELPLPETEAWFRGLTAGLTPNAKALLQQLAILRTRFDYPTAWMLGGEREDVAASVLGLLDRYLLQRHDDERYTVTGLVATLQVKQMSEAERQEAHRKSARVFVRQADAMCSSGQTSGQGPLLLEAIHHFEQGRAKDEYLKRADEAFELLTQSGDWDRAEALAERTVQVLCAARDGRQANRPTADADRELRWRIRAADLALERDQRDRARKHLQAAQMLLPSAEMRLTNEQKLRWAALRVELLLQHGHAAYQEPAYEEARVHCQQALDLARAHKLAEAEMRCLARLAQVERQQGGYEEARAHNAEVVSMARTLGNAELLCQGLSHLGLIARKHKQYPLALGYLEEALEVARAASDPIAIEMCLGHLGRTALLSGDVKAAEEKFRDCLQQARDLRSVRGIRFQLTNLCEALVRLGKREEAEELLAESEHLNEAAKDCIGQAFNLKHRGLLKKQVGEEAEGQQLIRMGIHILESAGNQEYLSEFEQALNEGAQLRLEL